MGFKSAVQSVVNAAFNAIGDIKTDISIVTNNSNPSYNPSTGAITSSSTSYSLQAVVVKYNRREIDGASVLATDAKIIVNGSDISVVPTTTDTIVIDSVTWNILNVLRDPSDSILEIHARRA